MRRTGRSSVLQQFAAIAWTKLETLGRLVLLQVLPDGSDKSEPKRGEAEVDEGHESRLHRKNPSERHEKRKRGELRSRPPSLIKEMTRSKESERE